MKVAIEMLKEMPSGNRACSDVIKWFAQVFPNGGDFVDFWNACDRDDWKIWFACNYVDRESLVQLAFKFAGQAFCFAAMAHPSLRVYADNVNSSNLSDAFVAAVAAKDDCDAAYAAEAAEAAEDDCDAAYAVRAARAAEAAEDDCDAAYAADAAYDAAEAAYDAYAAYDSARTKQVQWCFDAIMRSLK